MASARLQRALHPAVVHGPVPDHAWLRRNGIPKQSGHHHLSAALFLSLPGELEFSSRGMYVGHNSLRVYDYFLFAQEAFLDWVRAMREKIRETGSRQLITAGQDEGGVRARL